MKFTLKQFQEDFVFSQAKHPAQISGWATGKTLDGIARGIEMSKAYPKNLGVIVRNEYTDLRDSTLKDYTDYTGRKINEQKKEDTLTNGSKIMFRHGKELNLLKNINLGWFWMEQAEEFESSKQFFYLKGRLRRKNVGLRTGFITANANGHNWIWELWKQNQGKDKEYPLIEATTLDNLDVLPKDFLDNINDIKIKAPSIYRQFVLNDQEEATGGRWFIPIQLIESALSTHIALPQNRRLIAVDPSLGGNETVIMAMENTKILEELVLQPGIKDTMKIAGETAVMAMKHHAGLIVVDAIGIGRGIADRLQEMKFKVCYINSAEEAGDKKRFINLRAEMWWKAGEKFMEHTIDIGNPKDFNYDLLKKQLSAVKYEVVDSKGRIKAELKDDVAERLGCSPDRADAYIYGLHGLQYAPIVKKTKDAYDFEDEEPKGTFMGT